MINHIQIEVSNTDDKITPSFKMFKRAELKNIDKFEKIIKDANIPLDEFVREIKSIYGFDANEIFWRAKNKVGLIELYRVLFGYSIVANLVEKKMIVDFDLEFNIINIKTVKVSHKTANIIPFTNFSSLSKTNPLLNYDNDFGKVRVKKKISMSTNYFNSINVSVEKELTELIYFTN